MIKLFNHKKYHEFIYSSAFITEYAKMDGCQHMEFYKVAANSTKTIYRYDKKVFASPQHLSQYNIICQLMTNKHCLQHLPFAIDVTNALDFVHTC